MIFRLFIIAFSAVVLTGCISNPMTAEEFRTAVKSGHPLTVKPQSFVVDRPLSAVVATFKKQAPDCLDLKKTAQEKPTIGFAGSPHVVAISKSTVLASAGKMEFYLQVKSIGNLAQEPPDGMYMLIADAKPIGKNKTQFDLYRPRFQKDVIVEALKGWAAGTNLGCPDPSSFM